MRALDCQEYYVGKKFLGEPQTIFVVDSNGSSIAFTVQNFLELMGVSLSGVDY
jgi:hypothetical protein